MSRRRLRGPLVLCAALAAATSGLFPLGRHARASRFEDLGPGLGLPLGSPGASTGDALVAGISAVDLDGDGDLDLLTTDPRRGVTVYLREGDTFRDAPEWLAIAPGECEGHTLFDMDGDGDLDLFLAREDDDRLLENTGTKLVDVTADHLPRLPGWTFTATAADLDGDGDLDLALARYLERVEFPSHRCYDNLLFVNDGHGRFADVSARTGYGAVRGCSFMSVAFDLDADADLDLVTINDFAQFVAPLELWQNLGRDPDDGLPRFAEVARERGLDAPVYGMGVAIGDLDQNGLVDLFVTNIGEPLLFELGADGALRDVSAARGMRVRFANDKHLATWTARALDLDRDGHLDVLAAAGALPATAMIGNGPDMQPLWLRGDAAGRLAPPDAERAFAIPGNAMRDFELADIDGDGRPEIVAIHVHGGLSVLRDRDTPPLPTTVRLVPSTTAPGAAGAVLALSCDGVSRARHVLGGGAYGNLDDGRVDVAFPPPCDIAGRRFTGRVTWPSGYVQALEGTTGEETVVREDAWLTRDGTRVTVDLDGHGGAFTSIEARGIGAEVGAPEPLGAKRWRFDVTPGEDGGAIELLLDGAPLGVLVRVARPPIEVWLDPPQPIAGRSVRVIARLPPGDDAADATLRLGDEDGVVIVGPDGSATATFVPPAVGASELEVVSASAARVVPLEVRPLVSLARSEVVARDLHVLLSELQTTTLRFRIRLRDDNGADPKVPAESLALSLDGVADPTLVRSADDDALTVLVPYDRVHDGSIVQVLLDGAPLFEPFRVAQLASGNDMVPLVATARSRCALSEPRLWADGRDRGTAVVLFYDARGVRMRALGLTPLVEAEGVTVLEREVKEGSGGWEIPVRAGEAARVGRLTVRLPGQAASAPAVTCELPLVAPPPMPELRASSPFVIVPNPPRLDERATLRFLPAGVDQRAVGSGVAFRFEVEGADAAPLEVDGGPLYVGFGRYEMDVVPRLLGPLVVRARAPDGRVLGTGTWEVPSPDEDPEAGPEVVEVAEVVEVVEVAEPEVAVDGAADAGADEDARDIADEDTRDVAEDDARDVADEDDAIGGDGGDDGPDDAGPNGDGVGTPDTADPSDPSEPSPAEPDVSDGVEATDLADAAAAPEAEARARRDDGCATGRGDALVLALAFAATALLAGAGRRARSR